MVKLKGTELGNFFYINYKLWLYPFIVMDRNKSEVKFLQENVIINSVGPLKDEASFIGTLLIIDEYHGLVIEWHPLKLIEENRNPSPELENLDWEEVSSSVGYKSNHDDSNDAVEIKSVCKPNIKIDIRELNSFKKIELPSENKVILTFYLKDGTNVPSMHFEREDFDNFFLNLCNYISYKKSKKDENLYLIIDSKAEKTEALDKSFSELDLFSDSKSDIIKKIIQDPVHTALGGFSKVTNLFLDYMVYNNTDSMTNYQEEDITKMISGNFFNVDINHHEEPGYEIITCIELPPRPEISRSEPVSLEEWNSYVDSEGRITDPEGLKLKIFKGGLVHSARSEAWKYLLGYYSFSSTTKEKQSIKKQKNDDYYRMKIQWKTISADQESRFAGLRERKSLIEKDVSRTDRTHPFYEGENNINIQMLQDILMTYCMYNFDLGYVQGMSDLLSPILVVMQNEPDAFWCFASWLETIGINFELEQQGIKTQLSNLYKILYFVDTQLCDYLEKHESGNMYFAFRWLLILFKRDFKFQEIMRLWEVLWTGLPCKNFHLLLCVAILDAEKLTIMENNYGISEILKHVNEMSYKINLDQTLCKAEAIYYQIKNSTYQSDIVNSILGIQTNSTTVKKPADPPKKSASPVPIVNNEKGSTSDTTSSSIDDYVDLETQYQLSFNLFT